MITLTDKLRLLGGNLFSLKDFGWHYELGSPIFFIDYNFSAFITKFRVKDVIISARSVSNFINFTKQFENITNIEVYYQTPFDNILPTNKVRADGRLEIPSYITQKYNLRRLAPTAIPLTLRLFIRRESRELTAYKNYITGEKGGDGKSREYKILVWYPITFPYRNPEDRNHNLNELYRDELISIWRRVYNWLNLYIPDNEINTGLTNRVKRYIFPFFEYEKVRALVLDAITKSVVYDLVGLKPQILSAIDAWLLLTTRLTYPQCVYEIFLDLDDFILIKYGFYTVEDYVEKFLVPKLKENNVKYNRILVFLSSRRFLSYNYHIVVETELGLNDWLKIDKFLIEHDVRKEFSETQKFSVLRISKKSYEEEPKLIKIYGVL